MYGFDALSGHTENLKNGTCGVFSLLTGGHVWVKVKPSRSLLPLARLIK